MNLPNRFKIAWWAILVFFLIIVLHPRYAIFQAGRAQAADIVLFGILFALLLAPLFSEVTLLGITLKQQTDELKGFISNQISSLQNNLEVRNTFSPHFNFNNPPSDEKLPEIEKEINKITASFSNASKRSVPASKNLSDRAKFLISTRISLESEIRKMLQNENLIDGAERYTNFSKLLKESVHHRLINVELANAIREVYSVCSSAAHGIEVTDAQFNFIQDTGQDLIAILHAMQDGEE